MSSTQPTASDEPTPGAADQVDEAFRALLEGLRTTLPGVEVLLAFLLILPLQTGFEETDPLQRTLYLVAVTTSALAAVLLIAPSAHQRVRAVRKQHRAGAGVPRRNATHLRNAVRLALAGTVLGALAMTSAVGLAGTFLLGAWGLLLGGAVGLTAAWTWFIVPAVIFD